MPSDPLTALFGGTTDVNQGLGQGAGGADARAMAIMQAMKSQQTGRTATPMGSIAQAIMPLLMVPILQRAQEAKNQERQLKLDYLKAQIDAAKSKGNAPDILGFLKERAAQQAAAGQTGQAGVPAAATGPMGGLLQPGESLNMGPSGASLRIGQPPQGRLLSPAEEAQQIRIAGATAGAREAAKPPKPAKPLNSSDIKDYSEFLDSIDTLDSIIPAFERGDVTKKDVLKSTITGGMISQPVLREYATFYNALGHKQYGGAFTKNEEMRLRQQLPPPASYIVDPQGFVDALRVARGNTQQGFSNRLKIQSEGYKIPPYLKSRLERFATTSQVTAPSMTPDGVQIEPSSMARNKKTGQIRAFGVDGTQYLLQGNQWTPAE